MAGKGKEVAVPAQDPLQEAVDIIEGCFAAPAHGGSERVLEAFRAGELSFNQFWTWRTLRYCHRRGYRLGAAAIISAWTKTSFVVAEMTPDEIRQKGGVMKIHGEVADAEKVILGSLMGMAHF